MARLGALALATDQTRVFNLSVSEPGSQIFMPGDSLGYHQSTHEEPIDPVLGFQPRVAQYNVDTMELFAMLLKELDGIPEGDGTILDHSLVFAFTDQSFAKIHAVDGLPLFVAGGASGRMKSGHHVAGDSSPWPGVAQALAAGGAVERVELPWRHPSGDTRWGALTAQPSPANNIPKPPRRMSPGSTSPPFPRDRSTNVPRRSS